MCVCVYARMHVGGYHLLYCWVLGSVLAGFVHGQHPSGKPSRSLGHMDVRSQAQSLDITASHGQSVVCSEKDKIVHKDLVKLDIEINKIVNTAAYAVFVLLINSIYFILFPSFLAMV